MKIPIVSAFVLWGMAGYGAISIALAGSTGLDSGIGQGNVIPPSAASYSIKDAYLLLSAEAEANSITNSNLQLIGVFYSAEESKSLVLFSTGNQVSKPYRIGSELPNGMKVHLISQREVELIDTDGTIFSINMPKK